jgi:hypothetical protein
LQKRVEAVEKRQERREQRQEEKHFLHAASVKLTIARKQRALGAGSGGETGRLAA